MSTNSGTMRSSSTLKRRKLVGGLFQSLTFTAIVLALLALVVLLFNVYSSAQLIVSMHAFFDSQGASLTKGFVTEPPQQHNYLIVRNIDVLEKRNPDIWSQPQRRDAVLSLLGTPVRTPEDLWLVVHAASAEELRAAPIRWVPSEGGMFGDLNRIREGNLTTGFEVGQIPSGSPAAHAGLQQGDRIVTLDGISVSSISISARTESPLWLKIMKIALLNGMAETSINLGVERGEEQFELQLNPVVASQIRIEKKPLEAIWYFATSLDSVQAPELAGILTAIYGTIYIIVLTALIAFPLGVGGAIYLEEYAPKTKLTNIIQVNIANLAGVPSVVYGIIGLEIIARGGGIFPGLGRSILAGAFTLSLLILPIIVISAREALRAVPESMREAAFGVGASRWQVVRSHVLPYALPGAFTGVILALSRGIGETAPLVLLGAFQYVSFLPQDLMSVFTVVPIQIWTYISRPQDGFINLGSVAILVLLVVMLGMNAIAIFLRNRLQRRW